MTASIVDDRELSLAERLGRLDAPTRRRLLDDAGVDDERAVALLYDWSFWGRPKQQLPPGEWVVLALITGRGFGKTRAGSEAIYRWVREGYRRLAIVGRTTDDVRDTMLGFAGKGPSGILNVGPPDERPRYVQNQRAIYFPARRAAADSFVATPTRGRGAVGALFSADKAAQLRGPQHEKAWVDELAQFTHPEAWDNLLFGLRLGDRPQVIVTSTPRRTKLIRDLFRDPTAVVVGGSTYENLANLAPTFRARVIARYEGTRLGRQELYGQLLDDVVGALWTLTLIDATRVASAPALVRIVVAIDPQAKKTVTEIARERDGEAEDDESSETGIIVVGLAANGHAYVLEDVTLNGSPHEWASAAIAAYHRWKADRIVGEVNNGGDMVGFTIGTVDPAVPFSTVWASRGKYTRAEPISALYERRYVHHVGTFGPLEDQMTTWVPGEKSPDRMDALVWGVTELFYPQKGREEAIEDVDGAVRIGPDV